MRNIFLSLILILSVTLSANAQIDRSQQPEPGPAPVIQLGDFETFVMDNGMTVILVENTKVPVISFQLTLDTDPVFEGDAKGYVSLAGSLLREGTTNRNKQEIDEAIDFIGASLSTSSTGVFGSSLSRHRDTLLELMSDVLLHPSFPEEELQRLITQTRSGLATVQNDANAMASNVSQRVVYGSDHPYGEITTEETLENIDIGMIRQYYQDHFKPNVAYMVIVGDINLEETRELMDSYFGSWVPGEVPTRTYDTPFAPEVPSIAFAHRRGAVQSVVNVTYPVALTPGHEDVIKASVMNSILGGGAFSGRLMQNLREDKGYTYGARSNLSSGRLVGRFTARTEVRNEVTGHTVEEMLYEMRRMIEEPVEETSLELTKNFMTGSFARSLESPRTIANFALNTIRYDLPEDYYATYLENLAAVTAKDVQEVAAKYLLPENTHIVVAGNRDEAVELLRPFSPTGEVIMFDAFGRPVEEVAAQEVPEGYTAETVIENYLEAIGGREKIMNIRDMKQRMTLRVMGMEVQMITYKKAPHYVLIQQSMAGMMLSQQLFDGETGVVLSQMGREEFTEGPVFDQLKMEGVMNLEIVYQDHGIEKELKGIENVNGAPAYRVDVSFPSGMKVSDYYCVESGLKIQTVADEGETTMGDYREVDGLLVPHQITQVGGGQTIEIEMNSLEINTGLSRDIFVLD